MTTATITVSVNVHDEAALDAYLRDRWAVLDGPDGDKEPRNYSAPAKVLEALVLVNENPPPLDYGLEITNHSVA